MKKKSLNIKRNLNNLSFFRVLF